MSECYQKVNSDGNIRRAVPFKGDPACPASGKWMMESGRPLFGDRVVWNDNFRYGTYEEACAWVDALKEHGV